MYPRALTDLIVVHFAFGSPFAVYRITRGDIRTARAAASMGAYFELWPVFAAAFIRQWLSLSGRFLLKNVILVRQELGNLC